MRYEVMRHYFHKVTNSLNLMHSISVYPTDTLGQEGQARNEKMRL